MYGGVPLYDELLLNTKENTEMCETGALALPKSVIHYEHTHNETEPKIIRES